MPKTLLLGGGCRYYMNKKLKDRGTLASGFMFRSSKTQQSEQPEDTLLGSTRLHRPRRPRGYHPATT